MSQFRSEVIWNLASFVVLGISGILINIMIGYAYDAAALGVFNQVFAVYIFFSQFAVGGLHLSAQRHLSHAVAPTRHEQATIAVSSLLITTLVALVFALLFWASAPLAAQWMSSPDVGFGMGLASPGLFFFALNKVFLGILNGLRHMRAFAVFNSLRYVLMIATLVTAIVFRAPSQFISGILSVTEVVLFFALFVYCWPQLKAPFWRNVRPWIKSHLSFGTRGFGSGVLTELNTRVDILLLGRFGSDSLVGAYSMAALFAEGIFQLPALIRTNYNPLIARHLAARENDQVQALIRRGVRLTYAGMAAISLLAVLLYPLLIPLVTNKLELQQTWSIFALLMVGVFVASGYAPFINLVVQAGFPGLYTYQMAVLVAANALFNWLLIPSFGANGSAIGTSLAWFLSVPLLKWTSYQKLKLRI